MKKNVVRYSAVFVLIYVLISMVYTLPLLMSGPRLAFNEDLPFHIARLLGLTNVLKSPVNFLTFNQGGYGVNYFYPWITYLPAVFIFKITKNLALSFSIFVTFINFILLINTHLVMYKFCRKHLQAFLCAVLYLFSAYHSLNVFLRSDIGESISMAYIPLVVYGLYAILMKHRFDEWWILAIGMIAIGYSHLLSFMLMSIMCVILLLLNIIFDRQLIAKKLLVLTKTGIFSALALLFYFVPLFQQVHNNPVYQPNYYNLYKSSTSISEIVENSLNNNYFSIGIILFLCVIVAFIRWKKLRNEYKVSVLITVCTIFLLSNLFPSYLLNHTFLKTIQFVWRFYEIGVFFSVIVGSLLLYEFVGRCEKREIKVGTIVGLLILLITINFSTYSQNLNGVEQFNQKNQISMATHVENYDYVPKKAKAGFYDMLEDNFYVDGKKVRVKYHVSESDFYIAYNNRGNYDHIDVPVYVYEGQVIKNNNKLSSSKNSERGLTRVKLNNGMNRIEISYRYTILAIICAFISVSVFLLLLIISVRNTLKYDNNRNI